MKQRSLINLKPTKSAESRVTNAGRLNTPVTATNHEKLNCSRYDAIYCKIQQRRLQMLVHSCIYYELNTSIITDKQFDTWARELVKLQNENPSISQQVPWYEAFKDWDGTTGFNLPLRDSWVVGQSLKLLRYKGEVKEIE